MTTVSLIRVANLDELRGDGPHALSADGFDIVAVRTPAGVRAFEGRCPARAGSDRGKAHIGRSARSERAAVLGNIHHSSIWTKLHLILERWAAQIWTGVPVPARARRAVVLSDPKWCDQVLRAGPKPSLVILALLP